MRKIWLVAQEELKRNVLKRSFILMLLSMPLMVGLNVGLGVAMEALNQNDAPIGYIDQSGLLEDPVQIEYQDTDERVEFLAFDDEARAQHALEADLIQAYYVLSAGYEETTDVELVYLEEPGENATRQFSTFLQLNLVQGLPQDAARRATEGSHITIRSLDGSREFPDEGPALGHILPIILAFAFAFLLVISSGYIMSGVAEEKQNRTMEVLVTSLSSGQMITGKVVGIVTISFIQLMVWVAFGVLAVVIGGQVLDIAWFQDPQIDWGAILRIVVIAVPSYIMASAIMFTIGATITEIQEGQSIGALFFMLFMLPLYMIVALVEVPNSALATTMSLAPFTALLAMAMRGIFFSVPVWQVVLSAAIQTLTAVLAIWLAGRAFRLGMLRYGQRLSLRVLFGKVERGFSKAGSP
jgi:ABC-2 type transport system permease protein